MSGKCLMGVYAHPDDEAFGVGGTLRRYSDEGVRTALVMATRGEAGEISDPALATPQTLGQVREEELRESCRMLGIQDLSFLDYHDGTLDSVDEDEAVERIVRQIRRLRPQVMVTFDANGGYGHFDHMAIHRLTVTAFHRAGDPACYPEQRREGLEPYAPQKLYLSGFARSVMARMRAVAESAGVGYRPGGDAATLSLEQMGTEDERITTTILLDREQCDAKLAARAAHRTQRSTSVPVDRLPPDVYRAWLATEYFVLLCPPGAPADKSEHDLFAGVNV